MAGSGKVVAIMNALPSPIAASFRSGGLGARLLRPLVNRLMPGGPTPIVVRSGAGKGLRLLIDPRSEKYYWTGTHETPVQEAVSTFLKPGMTFWDIGAHIGLFALIGGRLVGDSGHVGAFEPMPENFDRLRANIEGNALGNVEAHCVALSDEEGSGAFVTLGSSLKGHFAQGKDRVAEGVVRVHTRTVDTIVSRGGRIPDLLKIDVEGAEGRVIRGAAETMRAHRPAIVIEIHSAQAGREVADALPIPYLFQNIATGEEAALPLVAGHYFARAGRA